MPEKSAFLIADPAPVWDITYKNAPDHGNDQGQAPEWVTGLGGNRLPLGDQGRALSAAILMKPLLYCSASWP